MPLVADIHFQPGVAMMVAECFEKIRVNPGNFADGRKTFEVINYEDPKQFEEERAYIEEVGGGWREGWVRGEGTLGLRIDGMLAGVENGWGSRG